MNKRAACKINDIGYPSADKITGRISTLRRSMACTLLNRDACTPEQEQEWLRFFPDNKCAYCGQTATHLDHLHPMIRNNEPTGFGTDPGNLVPCCKKCNTPKSNMDWEDFMRSDKCKHTAKGNLTLQESIDERIQNIRDFQMAIPAKHTTLTSVMKQQWKDQLNALEKELQKTADMLMDMKRQLYGNNAPATLQKTASTNSIQKSCTTKNPTRSAGTGRLLTQLIFHPADEQQFKDELLKSQKAHFELTYTSGEVKKAPWNAKGFKHTSKLRGNIESKNFWRNRLKDGLIKVEVYID